jgi:hypothetical protein
MRHTNDSIISQENILTKGTKMTDRNNGPLITNLITLDPCDKFLQICINILAVVYILMTVSFLIFMWYCALMGFPETLRGDGYSRVYIHPVRVETCPARNEDCHPKYIPEPTSVRSIEDE